jgi:hypothetical protein
MAQTFDLYANLYETWRETFNRLEHSLKINRSYSDFKFILSSPQRNRISTIPPRKSKFWYFWVTLVYVVSWVLSLVFKTEMCLWVCWAQVQHKIGVSILKNNTRSSQERNFENGTGRRWVRTKVHFSFFLILIFYMKQFFRH